MATEKRLIDANALLAKVEKCTASKVVKALTFIFVQDAPTVDAIPIEVMKRKISGICAADQCDQAGRYDYELRNALQTVLEWYGSPSYKECKDGRRE